MNNFSVSFGKSGRSSANFGHNSNQGNSPQQKGYALRSVYLTGQRQGFPERSQTSQMSTRGRPGTGNGDIPISVVNSSLKYTASNKGKMRFFIKRESHCMV